MIFLDLTSKAKSTKAKINKWDYIKLKSCFLYSKENKQNEKATYRMGKKMANHVFAKEFNIQNIKRIHTTP